MNTKKNNKLALYETHINGNLQFFIFKWKLRFLGLFHKLLFHRSLTIRLDYSHFEKVTFKKGDHIDNQMYEWALHNMTKSITQVRK